MKLILRSLLIVLLLVTCSQAQGIMGGVQAESYILNDNFTTDLTAGNVNGTAAEPGPGARAVVDTGNNLSLSNSKLTVAINGNNNDPHYSISQIINRQSGRLLVGNVFKTVNNTSGPYIGYDSSPPEHPDSSCIYFRGDGSVYHYYYDGNNKLLNIANYSGNQNYNIAIALRTTGSFIYIKGGLFTNWTLLYVSELLNTASVYPIISGFGAAWTNNFIRIPTQLWLPVPLCSDGFSTTGTTDGLGHAEGTTGCGIVLRYKDASNYVYCWQDGTNTQVIKVVAGTPSTVLTAVQAYGAGNVIVGRFYGTSIYEFYNNALTGTGTISDGDLQTGLNVGLIFFDTDSTVDNYAVYAGGYEGQYDWILNRYSQSPSIYGLLKPLWKGFADRFLPLKYGVADGYLMKKEG